MKYFYRLNEQVFLFSIKDEYVPLYILFANEKESLEIQCRHIILILKIKANDYLRAKSIDISIVY